MAEISDEIDAVVAGHICLDVFPDLTAIPRTTFEAIFSPGRLIEVGPAFLSTGGAVSNTGQTLHKLGIATQLMGKVGDDLFGRAVREIVTSRARRLADGMIVDKTVNTSYTIIINLPGVDRMFLHCPGANDTFSAADVRYDLLERARLFHFGYPPIMKLMYWEGGSQLVDTFRRAKETGVTTSLDMALPDPASASGKADWVGILHATLPQVDIFLPSIEEILYMLRRDIYDQLRQVTDRADILPLITPELLSDLGRQLIAMGVKIIALKLGDRGMYVRTASRSTIEVMGRACPSAPATWADRELWAPCFTVDVVGAAGSGDATIAGFLSALLRDMTPEEVLTAAVAVGACNVEAADTLSGVRPWQETLDRIAAGWSRHDLSLTSPGWRFDGQHQMWVGPCE